MKLAVTIVEVPSGQGSWKATYATFLEPAKAVQQWHERRDLHSLQASLNPRSGYIETPLVRAWTVQVPAVPDRRPWYARALKKLVRGLASALHLLLFSPVRRPDGRARVRFGAR
jgi:hypothetical protein